MRILTARLSAARRSRIAGPVVLLLALLMTGGFYSAFAPASAEDAATEDQVAQGRELFLVGCSSCHGKNGEGITTEERPVRPLPGRRRRRRRRLPGRHRPHADGRPRRAGAQKDGRLHRGGDRSARGVRRLASAPARPSPTPEMYDPETIPEDEREEAIVRGGEFFRTNCTACHNFAATGGALPGGKYAPSLVGVEPRPHLRGADHRPAADAGLLRRGPRARAEARHHRLPRRASRRRRTTAAPAWAPSAP